MKKSGLFNFPVFLAVVLGAGVSELRANPAGGVAIHGDVTLESLEGLLNVHQLSDKAIIHWDDFSIPAGEITRFLQPGKDSAALNRVVTGNPSAIYGRLESNGRVLLINPNGILVGPGGVVDTGGGFLASTLDLPDGEFLAGGDLTLSGASTAGVTNLGTIVAREGDVFLVSAGPVANAGAIEAPNGTAGLAAGSRVVIRAAGEERVFVEAGSASGSVDHSGTIRAAQAELKAAGGNAASMAVTVNGVVEATGVSRQGGRILLTGGGGGVSVGNGARLRAVQSDGAGGEVRISGGAVSVDAEAVIDASGTVGGTVAVDSETNTTVLGRVAASGSSGMGGRIEVTGQNVSVDEGASLNASGSNGGGEVFVGGGFQGSDPALRNAETTTVGRGAVIDASAVLAGSAGRVIVWADRDTLYRGDIRATAGGTDGGAGGFAEVSGKQNLLFRGTVDLVAVSGPNGTLLLDPNRVVIVDGPAGAALNSGEIADGVILATDGGAVDFAITTGDIAAVGGNVLIQANNEVTDLGTNATINAGGDFAVQVSNGPINLGNTTINAPGHTVNLIATGMGGSVGYNQINTAGNMPGQNGGNVNIFAGDGSVAGNGIDASGADGGMGNPNGGNGGNIVINDISGGNPISYGMINNSGGDGANGDASTPGGNGGNGGLISIGNTSGNPSMILPAPPIQYFGGNGGNGTPPGMGGVGGPAFFNNGTATPNNIGPDGLPGQDLSGMLPSPPPVTAEQIQAFFDSLSPEEIERFEAEQELAVLGFAGPLATGGDLDEFNRRVEELKAILGGDKPEVVEEPSSLVSGAGQMSGFQNGDFSPSADAINAPNRGGGPATSAERPEGPQDSPEIMGLGGFRGRIAIGDAMRIVEELKDSNDAEKDGKPSLFLIVALLAKGGAPLEREIIINDSDEIRALLDANGLDGTTPEDAVSITLGQTGGRLVLTFLPTADGEGFVAYFDVTNSDGTSRPVAAMEVTAQEAENIQEIEREHQASNTKGQV